MRRLRATSANASQTHLAKLLAHVETKAFRETLVRLAPSLAGVPGSQLLARFKASVNVAEIVHGFPAANNATQNNALDLDISIALNATWFYNQWQLQVLFPAREQASYFETLAFMAPAGAMEVGTWQMTPFTGRNPFGGDHLIPGGWPADLSEASDRVLYAALNAKRMDFPAWLWGDVAVVFNHSVVRDMAVLTGVDSGDYTCDCNAAFTSRFCGTFNESSCAHFWFCHWNSTACAGGEAGTTKEGHSCEVWGGGGRVLSGTLDDFWHLLLPFADWYPNQSGDLRLALTLARALVPWADDAPPMVPVGFDYYWEADLAGNPRFPDGVKMVLADLPSLFGTDKGLLVQAWCRKWRWPLAWAGNSVTDHSGPLPANHRFLDPVVLATADLNVSASAAEVTAFHDAWQGAVRDRRTGRINNTVYQGWWSRLAQSLDGVLVQPLYGESCSRPDQCVGTLLTSGRCACKLA